jgi:hypothetical protein
MAAGSDTRRHRLPGHCSVYEKHPEAFLDVTIYPSNVFYPLKDDGSKYKPLDPHRCVPFGRPIEALWSSAQPDLR